MELVQRAVAILASTEKALRDLIAEGLEKQSYGEVAQLASLTERLTAIRSPVPQGDTIENRNGGAVNDPAQSSESEESHSAVEDDVRRVRDLPRSKRDSYPKFQIDGDKLVKIGWSQRDRRAYEHRAPKAVVAQVCEALSRRSARGRRFRMEEVLPELGAEMAPIPSYQAYVTLAWLRNEGVVERDGKDGYRVRNGPLSNERLEKLWNSLSGSR